MRVLLFVVAAFCAACSPVSSSKPGEGVGGYRLEVRASDAEQIFLVTAPDGGVTGARADKGGESALLDASAIHALAAMPAANVGTSTDTANPNAVSIHAPGVSIQASHDNDNGKDDGGGNGDAHISLNFGGHGMQIDAHGDDGDSSHAAHVLITGADEAGARNFITHADEISPAVQAQMLAALGLH